MTVAIELDQKGSQVAYDYTVSGAFSKPEYADVYAAVGLCYPTDADAYDCAYMRSEWTYNKGQVEGWATPSSAQLASPKPTHSRPTISLLK